MRCLWIHGTRPVLFVQEYQTSLWISKSQDGVAKTELFKKNCIFFLSGYDIWLRSPRIVHKPQGKFESKLSKHAWQKKNFSSSCNMQITVVMAVTRRREHRAFLNSLKKYKHRLWFCFYGIRDLRISRYIKYKKLSDFGCLITYKKLKLDKRVQDRFDLIPLLSPRFNEHSQQTHVFTAQRYHWKAVWWSWICKCFSLFTAYAQSSR